MMYSLLLPSSTRFFPCCMCSCPAVGRNRLYAQTQKSIFIGVSKSRKIHLLLQGLVQCVNWVNESSCRKLEFFSWFYNVRYLFLLPIPFLSFSLSLTFPVIHFLLPLCCLSYNSTYRLKIKTQTKNQKSLGHYLKVKKEPAFLPSISHCIIEGYSRSRILICRVHVLLNMNIGGKFHLHSVESTWFVLLMYWPKLMTLAWLWGESSILAMLLQGV